MNDDTGRPAPPQQTVVFPRRDALHLFILETFATVGRPPSLDEIRSRFALTTLLEAEERVAALERTGAIHRNPGDAAVTHAYPFSNEPTPHRVQLAGGPGVFAMCAIDALGLPFMLRRDAAIESACGECGAAVRVDITDGEIHAHTTHGIVVWLAQRPDNCVAATDLCPDLNFFCSSDHCSAWSERTRARGDRLSLPQALQHGRAIFEHLLHPPDPPPSSSSASPAIR